MLHLYVAGPYRAASEWEVFTNIMEARRAAGYIIQAVGDLGVYPIVPHLNTMLMGGLQSDEYFLEGTASQLLRCDGVYVQGGAGGTYAKSQGTLAEIELAGRARIPVMYDLAAVAAWARDQKNRCPACRGRTAEVRGKQVCQDCRAVVETCCEGGRG